MNRNIVAAGQAAPAAAPAPVYSTVPTNAREAIMAGAYQVGIVAIGVAGGLFFYSLISKSKKSRGRD